MLLRLGPQGKISQYLRVIIIISQDLALERLIQNTYQAVPE